MTMTVTMKAAARPPSVEWRGRRARRYTELPDPPKKMDMRHSDIISEVKITLKNHYGDDPSALIGNEAYLRLVAGERSCFAVPDCIIAFGVEARRLIWEANGYVISEIGKPPDVVMEIASESTGVRDYTVKRRIYERMRAGEYWRFDPSGGQYHDAPLAGDILVDGEYRRITITVEPDGTFWGYSSALALYLVWDDGRLRFFNPAVGEFLPNPSEYARERDEAVRGRDEAVRRAESSDRRADMSDRRADRADRRANAERAERIMSERRAAASERRADEADQRADASERRADESDRRAAEAEAELERLRRLLGDM